MVEIAPKSGEANRSKGVVARFELEYAEYKRQKRLFAMVFFGAFMLCLGAAFWTTKFNPYTLVQGLPRTTDFLSQMLPPLRMATFSKDFAEWYWGAGEWFHNVSSTVAMREALDIAARAGFDMPSGLEMDEYCVELIRKRWNFGSKTSVVEGVEQGMNDARRITSRR